MRLARSRSRLSKRELARRAHTSAAAIVEYESGRRDPTYGTLQRILGASGHRAVLTAEPTGRRPDPVQAGVRLAQVLELAEHLPHRPAARRLRYPGFPR